MKKYILVILIGFLMQTCIDPFEFSVEEPERILVVDGKITNSTEDAQTIRLTYTTEFGKINNPPVENALILLKDDEGNAATFVEDEPGLYSLDPNGDMQGTIGKTYHIEINLPNGKQYISTPETMQPTPVIDDIFYTFTEETVTNDLGSGVTNNYMRVHIGTPIIETEQGLLLRWDVEDVYQRIEPPQPWNPFFSPKSCFKHANTNPQDVLLFDARNLGASRIDDNIVATKRIDVTFWEKHYFNVSQYSLTQNAYNYWSELDKIANNVGGLFDTPPATVRGNIQNVNDPNELVLGYFEASSSSLIRIYTFRQDIPYTIPDPCNSSWNLPEQCLNCLVIPGSTTVRPHYW